MPIDSPEDGKEYLDKVHLHLMELGTLSVDAGLNTHAAIWYAIAGAFKESMDEVKTITDMIQMYLDQKMKADSVALRERLYPDKE